MHVLAALDKRDRDELGKCDQTAILAAMNRLSI